MGTDCNAQELLTSKDMSGIIPCAIEDPGIGKVAQAYGKRVERESPRVRAKPPLRSWGKSSS